MIVMFRAICGRFPGIPLSLLMRRLLLLRLPGIAWLAISKGKLYRRRLATPDAIMLASAAYLSDAIGIRIDAFHTFDDGKRRSREA